MKTLLLLSLISAFLLLGVGCQTQQKQTPSLPPPAVEELQIRTNLYRGSWFDIEYPKEFTARPTTPINVYNSITHILTDEAYFFASDGSVEFFVYSPLWSGDPETYLTVAPTEEMVSEKIEEVKENEHPDQFGDKIVRWVTIKAKDGSYYRSFVSTKEQINTGNDLHRVFGIKYKDNASYEKYRDVYIAFKKSLRQYAE